MLTPVEVYYYDGAAMLQSIPLCNSQEDRFAMAFLNEQKKIRRTARKVSAHEITQVACTYAKSTDSSIIVFPQEIFEKIYTDISFERAHDPNNLQRYQ